MRKITKITIIVIVFIIGALFFASFLRKNLPRKYPKYVVDHQLAETTTIAPPQFEQKQTISDGNVIFGVPFDFAIATSSKQISVRSYIPSCDTKMDYCIYYSGKGYASSTFESAGIRMLKRSDLKDEVNCMNKKTENYNNLSSSTVKTKEYSTSVFYPIDDAGMGHFSSGEIYRLFVNNICYEFETRIGQSRYENYKKGSIVQFTSMDLGTMKDKLHQILFDMRLMNGQIINFAKSI